MAYGKFRLIDLFCGCGGMTQGFVNTGKYVPVFANDWNRDAIESYCANFDRTRRHTVPGDIVGLVEDPGFSFPKADVVIGGPPCQGFSLLNKKRHGDPRRALWYQFMRVVDACGAQVIVMENVRQLLDSFEHGEIMAIDVHGEVCSSVDLGLPNTRRLAIIVGCGFSNSRNGGEQLRKAA